MGNKFDILHEYQLAEQNVPSSPMFAKNYMELNVVAIWWLYMMLS